MKFQVSRGGKICCRDVSLEQVLERHVKVEAKINKAKYREILEVHLMYSELLQKQEFLCPEMARSESRIQSNTEVCSLTNFIQLNRIGEVLQRAMDKNRVILKQ